MRITLKGHSGAEVTTDNIHVFKRVASQKEYERLVLSVSKQLQFLDCYGFKASKNVSFNWSEKTVVFSFIPNDCIVDFISKTSLEESSWFFSSIEAYLRDGISHAGWSLVSSIRIKSKTDDMEVKIRQNNYLSENQKGRAFILLDSVLNMAMPVVNVPFGSCHGDMTFSNMLITGKQCHLIDFLDSWIDSPLIDMAKLQQEAHFGWACRMKDMPFNDPYKTKSTEILESIFNKLEVDFPDIKKPLKIFTIINHLRLLQYEKDAEWAEKILIKTEELCTP